MFDAVSRLEHFGKRVTSSIPLLRNLNDHVPLIGPAWAAHPLRHTPRIHGYGIHEPHLTKTLAEFLRPNQSRRRGNERAHAFLAALYQAGGMPAAVPVLSRMTGAQVTAEQAAGRSARRKRIDMFFAWREDGARRIVAVEIKFRHIALRGTLPAYRQYIQEMTGSDRSDLFIVSLRQDALARRNKTWVQVGWFNLLRLWEQHLAENNDTDDDFARFRAELWGQLRSDTRA